MNILYTLLLLALVVFVHEYGHYFVMRRNGVKVIEFTIGFGPTLWSTKLKSGTMFKLKLLPLGGYTRPVARKPGDTGEHPEGSIERATAWVKFKIYMAGMFFNVTTAFFAYLVFSYSTGKIPVVVIPILRALHTPQILVPAASAFIASFGLWLATPFLVVQLIADGLTAFFSSASGPVGIIAAGNEMIGSARTPTSVAANMLFFFAWLNVALAGFNLLPIFPLDGGRIFDMVFEKFDGTRAGRLIRQTYKIVCLSMIYALFISLIVLDFVHLVRGTH